MTDLFGTFSTTYKQTHASANGQQTQIGCSRPHRKFSKSDM